jgi:hypothetical protein
MRKSKTKKTQFLRFDYEKYLSGEYTAYHINDLNEPLDIVSFRDNKVLGWNTNTDSAFVYVSTLITLIKRNPIVWVNVVRNKNGIIFSRVTNTADTKSQSGNIIIKQYKLELED